MKTKTKLILAAYFLGVVLTYGKAYRDELQWHSEHFPDAPLSSRCSAEMTGFFDAVFWPVYWSFTASNALWAKNG